MSEPEVNLITKSEIQEALKMRGPVGWLVASLAMRIMGLNKANRRYRNCAGGSTYDFAANVMKEFSIHYDLKENQLDYIPREGPFLMLANHHFGGIDGMMTLDILGHIRPDLHTVSTFLLGKVPEIKPNMFSVNPFSQGVGAGQGSLGGMRQALTHIRNGGCICLFASGEVATYQRGDNRTSWEKGVIEDIPWPISIVKFVRMCNCPVLPVYFEGTNSRRFHLLGKIHPMLRTINLVNETMNKEGATIPMRIGKPISVSAMKAYENLEDLYGFLRNRIYAMQAEFESKPRLPRSGFVRATDLAPEVASRISTVTFCCDCPRAIQSLIVWFFTEKYRVSEEFAVAEPEKPFVPYWRNVRPDQLLSKTDTVEQFDTLLREISDNAYCLPESVVDLFREGARVICFGTDPDAGNSLEGLVLLPHKNTNDE